MARKERNNKENHNPSQDYDEKNSQQTHLNEVDEFNNEPPMLSRSDSRRGKKKSLFRYPLLNILIVFFLLIPIVIIIVFVAVQNLGNSDSVEQADSGVKVSKSDATKEKADKEKAAAKEKKEKAAKKKAEQEKVDKEKADKEKADKEKANKEKIAQEQQASDEEAAKEKAAQQQAEKTQKEQQQAAEQRTQEQQAAREKAAREKAASDKPKEQQRSSGGSHTVKSGDTLYSIARSFYGNAGASAGVAKIKRANGLSSDSVPVGTTLVIPK